MCLIALAWRAHPRYRLVLAANRDEFHDRPTRPLSAWDDAPDVVGGRDLQHGGSWLALRGPRLAAVTNVRLPGGREGLSRGALVSDFVRSGADSLTALAPLADSGDRYRPFNLLVHDGETLAYATNLPRFAMRALTPGVHGLSNGELGAPWPKTEAMMAHLQAWLDSSAAHAPEGATPDLSPLFEGLADARPAEDARLPDTGVGLEKERFLSPAFIGGVRYGTRASTVVLISEERVDVIERRFGPAGAFEGETRLVL
jgi:uncharacterized protein with NRDE domain